MENDFITLKFIHFVQYVAIMMVLTTMDSYTYKLLDCGENIIESFQYKSVSFFSKIQVKIVFLFDEGNGLIFYFHLNLTAMYNMCVHQSQ